MEFTFHVKGMTCGHCVARVKQTLESLPGMQVKNIELSTGEAVIESNHQPDIETLNLNLAEVGAYTIEA